MKMSGETKEYKGIAAIFIIILVSVLSFSCGSSVNRDTAADENLQQLISERHFEIENDWAMPLRGSQINLIGNTNYIRFKNDSVDLFLPYFGVRHTGGGYNSEGGIKYEGIARNLDFSQDKDSNTVISFEGRRKSESLDFRIVLYPNMKAYTNVTSSERDPISYRGEVHQRKEQE